MSQGRKKPSIFITGHRRGIGKAIHDLFSEKNWICEGVSQSAGFDIEKDNDRIIDMLIKFDVVVLNAYKDDSQLSMLKKIVSTYRHKDKKIIVITSTSGTDVGRDWKVKSETYVKYCGHKKDLIEYIEKIQQELFNKPLNVYDVCPDTVDTDMTKDLWNDHPKLKASHVAECVWDCANRKYNINRIVIQQHAD